MKYLEKFEDFNPALFVPGMLMHKNKKQKEETLKSDECKYKNIKIGEYIEFDFDNIHYKLDFDFDDFNYFLDNPEKLCKAIENNKNEWQKL